MKHKIAIVDDHKMFRDGIKVIIEQDDNYEIIFEAASGEEFLNKLPNINPDIVLMDISMAGISGVETTRLALELKPYLKIVALSMYSDQDYYHKMIDAGVKGFILKDAGSESLKEGIQTVLSGESYFSQELLRQIIQGMNKPKEVKAEKLFALTAREKEVLNLICEGLSSSEIAEKLIISVKTVNTHRNKLLEKTNSNNTAQLIMTAIKHKVIDF